MVAKSTPKTIQQKKPVKPAVAKKQPVSKPAITEEYDILEVVDLHTKHLLQMDEMFSSLQDELKDIRKLIVSEKVSQTDKARVEAKKSSDSSWHVLIDPGREYTQKEIIALTKISQPTLSMAKVRGHIVTKVPAGKRGWVVLGSDLLVWDNARAIHTDQRTVASAKKAAQGKAKDPVKKVQAQKKPVPAKAKAVEGEAPANTTKAVAVQKVGTKALTVQESVKAVTTPAKTPAKDPAKAPAKPKKTVKAPVATTGKGVRKPVSKDSSETQVAVPADLADRINALTAMKKITQTQFGIEVDLPQKVIYEISTKKLKELSPASIQKITTVLKKYESK